MPYNFIALLILLVSLPSIVLLAKSRQLQPKAVVECSAEGGTCYNSSWVCSGGYWDSSAVGCGSATGQSCRVGGTCYSQCIPHSCQGCSGNSTQICQADGNGTYSVACPGGYHCDSSATCQAGAGQCVLNNPPTATPIPSPTPTSAPNPTTPPNPTTTPTSCPPAPTPANCPVPPNTIVCNGLAGACSACFCVHATPTTLTFKVKFQGITSQRPNQNVRVTLRQTGTTDRIFTVPVTSDTAGIYSYTGSAISVPAGIYDILLKGPVHLQKKFPAVNLSSNQIHDFTSTELKSGDITGDNTVNIFDFNLLSTDFEIGVPKISLADLNFDGKVDIFDFNLLSSNFSFGVYGDQ